jgi:hypothetical protein
MRMPPSDISRPFRLTLRSRKGVCHMNLSVVNPSKKHFASMFDSSTLMIYLCYYIMRRGTHHGQSRRRNQPFSMDACKCVPTSGVQEQIARLFDIICRSHRHIVRHHHHKQKKDVTQKNLDTILVRIIKSSLQCVPFSKFTVVIAAVRHSQIVFILERSKTKACQVYHYQS